MVDRVGQRIGHYHIVRLLGKGGFAEVYLGEHVHLGTQAAIKFLHSRLSAEDTQLFQQEARLIARLNHPHIVRVLDFGVEDELLYLVMSYAPHGTLRDRHPRGQRLSAATVVRYSNQVAQALQYAHEQKIIHRDIKPENMLISQRDEVLLSDFGIALIAQSTFQTDPASMAGTIPYMAPEQIEAHPLYASDQYALAVVAYEWLCGERPFQGAFLQLAYQHKAVAPLPLRERVPDLPLAMEAVIMRALAKAPEQRFPTVAAFAQELEQASKTGAPPFVPYPIPAPSGGGSNLGNAYTVPIAPPPPGVRGSAPTMQQFQPAGSPTYPAVPPHMVLDPLVAGSPYAVAAPVKHARKRLSRRALLLAGSGIVVGGGLAVYAASSLYTALSQTVVTYTGHAGPVYTLGWSPDGKKLASGSYDYTIQVWSALSGGQPLLIYRGHTQKINQLAWEPRAGTEIASCSLDDTMQVWSALNPGLPLVKQTAFPNMFNALAWSPDGKYLATGSTDTTVQVWDARANGGALLTYPGHSNWLQAVAWSPNNQYVASGGFDHTVQVWQAIKGTPMVATVQQGANVQALAWSPDGRRIASCAGNLVQVWQALTGKLQATFQGHTDEVLALAWSPDGTRIASCGRDHTVQIWQALSADKTLATYRGHSSTVRTVGWSPDGHYLASGSDDQTVKVWKTNF